MATNFEFFSSIDDPEIKEKIIKLDEQGAKIIFYFKWGADGSSGYSNYRYVIFFYSS